MKKAAKILVLLLFIVLTFTFVILRMLANGSEDNFFNQKYRVALAKNPLLRNLLALHFDGDGRFDYLGQTNKKLWIEIDAMAGLSIPQDSLDLLAKKIAGVTGEDVLFFDSDANIPFQAAVGQDQVKQLVDRYKNFQPTDGAYLYLLYLNSSSTDAQLLGSTYQEYGIVLYDQALKDLTQESPQTFSDYVQSTALHEFGHQLGLPHNKQANCLMNSLADTSAVMWQAPSDVLVDFCDYEKLLIRAE